MDYQSRIRKSFALLYPTGRAWQYVRGSEDREGIIDYYTDGVEEVYTDGIGESYYSLTPEFIATTGKKIIEAQLLAFYQAYSDAVGIENSILPDNDDFDETDAARWENTLRLTQNVTDLATRKSRISRQLNYPNGVLERSHYQFIEDQLRAAGFDVYVIENRFLNSAGDDYEVIDPLDIGTQDIKLGNSTLGSATLGGKIEGVNYTEIIANFVDVDLDNNFFNTTGSGTPTLGSFRLGSKTLSDVEINLNRDMQLQASFFICSASFPSFANVEVSRRDEFRQLVLKFKPTHALVFTYLNYI